jgi:uncharacterized protein (DUF302 family)
MDDVGLITMRSSFSVSETIERLTAAVTSRGLTVFAHIDHAANATEVAMPLRPTQVLIFGNPRAGTPLMQDQQTVGLDLPLRTLVWEDADGQAWASYDDPHWLATRHRLGHDTVDAVGAIAKGMQTVLLMATGGPAS